MATPTEEIKDRLDVVEFIKGYLELTPAGKNFKALCPFHQEKTPSFMVSPERQMWHCFGCGEGGDIFKFLMKYENLEFYESLRVLAEKAGVELKTLSMAEQRQFGVLYDINKAAAEFFEQKLRESKEAKEYLKERGLKGETAKEFQIGFAPNKQEELTVDLINRGFSIDDVVRAGMSLKTERGQYIDRFRGRVMFPIHNHFGKIVGFSGRILPKLESEKLGKYINSPDTPIFNKSRLLYGFWESKKFIQKEESALLVEGQMDFLLVWQDGVKNVVATSGTALTGDHLRTLRRLTNKIIMGFDADDAGHLAAERSIDLAGGHDFTVYILPLGKFDDPAEAAEKEQGFIAKAMKKSKPAMEYYIDRYISGEKTENIENRKIAIRAVLTKINKLWSPVERTHWINELSHKTGISEKDLVEEMEKVGIGEKTEKAQESAEKESRKLARGDIIAEQVLSIVSAEEDLRKSVLPYLDFFSERYKNLYKSLTGEHELNPKMKNLLDVISLQSGLLFGGYSKSEIKSEMNNLLKELESEYLRGKRVEIAMHIANAENSGDESKLTESLKEFDDISRKLQDIENAKNKN